MMAPQNPLRRILVALPVFLLIVSCTGTPEYQTTQPTPELDGPPTYLPMDPSLVADARPKREKLCIHCARPYRIGSQVFRPMQSAAGYQETGTASWYGRKFHGRNTSTGEPYDMFAMTAAHRTLPIPCYAQVTNLENGKSVVVKINDRGPFVGNRIIDLSYMAAMKLDMVNEGRAKVRVTYIDPDRGILSNTTQERPPQSYFFQVGAFQDPDRADRVKRNLRLAGFDSSLVMPAEVGNQFLYRVRVPVLKPDIETVHGRLKALGFQNISLIKPAGT